MVTQEEANVVARRRITKKQLREPDEFVTVGAKAMKYAMSHLTYIGLGVLLLAAIIVALVFWRQHQAASEDMAFTLLGGGIVLYQQEEKREEALPIFMELINDYPRTTAGRVKAISSLAAWCWRQKTRTTMIAARRRMPSPI